MTEEHAAGAGATRGLVALELRRLFTTRRWLIAIGVCMLCTWMSGSWLEAAAFNTRAAARAPDLYLALVNNLTFLGYLLLPSFAMLVSGTLAADRQSRFATLTLARSGSRAPLWAAKALAVFVAAVSFQTTVVLCCLAVSTWSGLRVASAPSDLALVPGDESAMVLFAPALPGDDMLLRVGLATAFLVLAFAALGTVVLALSVRWSKEYMPPALLLGVVFFDWLIVRFSRWDLYDRVSPSLHMLESTHFSTLPDSIPWASSLVYFGTALILGWVAGWVLFERVDV